MYTTLINPTQLQQLDAPLILDVRHDLMNPDAGQSAYETNHITNAHFLHLDHDLSGEKTGHNGRHPLPTLETLATKLHSLGMNNDTQVVVYDAGNSMMAARAWWLLRQIGHEAVAVLDGGLAAWQRMNGALESGTNNKPLHQTDSLTIRPALDRTVTAEQLMAHLDDGFSHIIDARAPERFSGEVEPIDPVGGHIPHAHNYFFMHNLNEDLTFKDAATLKQQWQTIFTHPNIVNQCGSGVTACHNILAQHIAGFDSGALYAGSWSEWCSDPQRPIAKSE